MIVHAFEAAEAGVRLAAEAMRGLRDHVRGGTRDMRRLPHRVVEQWALLWLNGVTAEDYYAYRLGRRELPWHRKREFLGDFGTERWREGLIPRAYRFVIEDRLILKRYLASLGVPVARLLGVVGPDGRSDLGDETPLRSAGDVVPWMTAHRLENVAFRPVRRGEGGGVLALGRRLPGTPRWEIASGGTIGAPELTASLSRLADRSAILAEERLAPHPALAEQGWLTTHGAQVITVLNGEPRIVMAALGTGGAADAHGVAALTAPIDVQSGRLGPARRASDGEWFERHPESGAAIAGRIVPEWQEGVRVACRAAEAMPFISVMGWELTFTDGGPVVSDAGDDWLAMFQVLADRGLLASPLAPMLQRVGAARHGALRRRPRPR